MTTISVLIADSHAFVRAGVRALLAQAGMEVAGEAADDWAAARLAAELTPDVVVLGADDANAVARLRVARPDQKILALTAFESPDALRLLLSAGADGYVFKSATAAELVRAVRAVAAGEPCPKPANGHATARLADPDGLSTRECEVLAQISLGYANKEIASRLKLSVKTVETYKARSMEKLGLRSRVDIVRFAFDRGWLSGAMVEARPALSPAVPLPA